MPGVVGVLKVNSVASSGVLHVGDAVHISPNSTVTSFAGAGSFNTGDFMKVNNAPSVTRVTDRDDIDSSNAANE